MGGTGPPKLQSNDAAPWRTPARLTTRIARTIPTPQSTGPGVPGPVPPDSIAYRFEVDHWLSLGCGLGDALQFTDGDFHFHCTRCDYGGLPL